MTDNRRFWIFLLPCDHPEGVMDEVEAEDEDMAFWEMYPGRDAILAATKRGVSARLIGVDEYREKYYQQMLDGPCACPRQGAAA